jgi:hypothetical protein
MTTKYAKYTKKTAFAECADYVDSQGEGADNQI